MSLESDLFNRKRADFEKLTEFGFEKRDGEYVYERILHAGMKAVLSVDANGRISGHVYDDFGEEYIGFRVSAQKGSFAADVRREYTKLLEETAVCFKDVPFASDQANRIAQMIFSEFGDRPVFSDPKNPAKGYFFRGNSRYALIAPLMQDDPDALFSDREAISFKADASVKAQLKPEDRIKDPSLMLASGAAVLPLDGRFSDEKIMGYLAKARAAFSSDRTAGERKEWIVPANPAYFDIDHAFSIRDTIYWKQSSKVMPGDLVYIYYGKPFAEIRYLCEAVETDLPFEGINDGPVHFEKMMRIHRLFFFEGGLLSREHIARFGVTNIRGPRYMPPELKKEILRLYPQMEETDD